MGGGGKRRSGRAGARGPGWKRRRLRRPLAARAQRKRGGAARAAPPRGGGGRGRASVRAPEAAGREAGGRRPFFLLPEDGGTLPRRRRRLRQLVWRQPPGKGGRGPLRTRLHRRGGTAPLGSPGKGRRRGGGFCEWNGPCRRCSPRAGGASRAVGCAAGQGAESHSLEDALLAFGTPGGSECHPAGLLTPGRPCLWQQ